MAKLIKLIFPAAVLIVLVMVLALPAADKGVSNVPVGVKCPVCGMFVTKFPDWTASARFKDGTAFYYDGPKDLFKHILEPSRYTPGKRQADVGGVTVKEYYSLESMDARAAYFVAGSDTYGPMGSELIPFKTEKDAAAFKLDHRGKRILRFNDVTLQIINKLN